MENVNILSVKKKRRKNTSLKRNRSIFFSIMATILWLWALSYIFVFLWCIATSLRNEFAFSLNDGSFFGFDDITKYPDLGLKSIYNISNFAKAFTALTDEVTGTTFFGMFLNSLWITIGIDFFGIVCKITTAYALAFYDFKGKKGIYKFFVLQMIIPSFGSMLSTYRLLANWGMLDNPLYFISIISGHGMTMLLFYASFVGLTKSYAEAARIDGAGEFRIFWQINLPMSKPIILALMLQSFIGLWQDYGSIILYFPSFPTLATGLFSYKTRAPYSINTPVYFAGLILANMPITVLFIIFNKTMLENITIGGLKG